MIRQKRLLLLSCSVILLCICVITGGSYALFTDSVGVTNHLQAGTLDVDLIRTNLTYRTMDEAGYLKTHTVSEPISFTDLTEENVFGITKDTRIIPGSYFEATMQIVNKGNVAFDYGIEIKMNDTANALAKQLQVTVTHPDHRVTVKSLQELAEGFSIHTGTLDAEAVAQSFSVKVEFLALADAENNLAQKQDVSFDLIVSAVQATR